jgi:hypothetical protein
VLVLALVAQTGCFTMTGAVIGGVSSTAHNREIPTQPDDPALATSPPPLRSVGGWTVGGMLIGVALDAALLAALATTDQVH